MFITFEGIEGSGKTTLIDHAAAFIREKGRTCILTREPGGTAIGQKIRTILLDPENREITPSVELLLYTADRAQHAETVIRPALAQGAVVLCDRYFDATMVYQGYARGLEKEMIRRLHEMMLDNLTPDVTLLLDLDPETGLSRAWKEIERGARSNKESRFEAEKLAFHQRVREGYLDMARREPGRYRIIDASQDVETVRAAALNILNTSLRKATRTPKGWNYCNTSIHTATKTPKG